MPEPRIVDVTPSKAIGVCARCRKECCNCRSCMAEKGGQPNICNRCYEAVKKEAVP